MVDGENPPWSPVVMTGSHNWSNSAETSNNENTLILQSGRIAGLYLQEFSARYRQFGGKDPIAWALRSRGHFARRSSSSMQNYPNPFNPSTTIEFTVGPAGPPAPGDMSAATTQVSFRSSISSGREVAVLADGPMPPGKCAVRFDARERLPAGSTFTGCRPEE